MKTSGLYPETGLSKDWGRSLEILWAQWKIGFAYFSTYEIALFFQEMAFQTLFEQEYHLKNDRFPPAKLASFHPETPSPLAGEGRGEGE